MATGWENSVICPTQLEAWLLFHSYLSSKIVLITFDKTTEGNKLKFLNILVNIVFTDLEIEYFLWDKSLWMYMNDNRRLIVKVMMK